MASNKRPYPKSPTSTPSSTPSASTSSPTLPRGLVDRRGNPSAKGTRLPSMRTPRDLTLGGVAKKTFTPNIPARREKKEEAKPSARASSRGQGRGQGRGDRARGRGRGRGRGEIIQSHSIFEEGPAAERNKSRYDISRGDEGPSRPSVSRRTIKTEDGDKSDIMDKLLKDDFIDFGEEDQPLPPVKLPMYVSMETRFKKETEAKTKPKVEAAPVPGKEEGDVKMEVEDDEELSETHVMRAITPPTTCTMADIFTKAEHAENDQLVFFQLPDVLPGFPKPPEDDHETRKKDQDSTEMAKCLSNFSEGKIGKLQMLRSGRVRLVVGSVVLDVNMGTPCSFLQSLVSLTTREAREDSLEPASGEIAVLAQVKHRLVCTPDFPSMIQLNQAVNQLGNG